MHSLFGEGVLRAGQGKHHHHIRPAGGKFQQRHQKSHRLLGQVGFPGGCGRRLRGAQVARQLIQHDERWSLTNQLRKKPCPWCRTVDVALLHKRVSGTASQLIGQLTP